jgi:hypothetical protein
MTATLPNVRRFRNIDPFGKSRRVVTAVKKRYFLVFDSGTLSFACLSARSALHRTISRRHDDTSRFSVRVSGNIFSPDYGSAESAGLPRFFAAVPGVDLCDGSVLCR